MKNKQYFRIYVFLQALTIGYVMRWCSLRGYPSKMRERMWEDPLFVIDVEVVPQPGVPSTQLVAYVSGPKMGGTRTMDEVVFRAWATTALPAALDVYDNWGHH
jgi:hypothetical protein